MAEKLAKCFVAFIAPGGSVDHKLYLAKIGASGGASKSKAKRKAAAENAVKARAAHKRAYPPCPGYHAHTWNAEGRCFSPKCREKYPDLRRRKPNK